MGMSAEQVARLFAPFEQADGSTTRRFGGTGLGLAISNRLVELMGGEIRVESQPDRGSSFHVTLPCIASTDKPVVAAQQTGAPGALPGTRRLAGIRILVAEDDEINRLVLANLLESEGARLAMADDGRQAVDCVSRAGRDAYDIVLMDIQMPQMDGYEATRRIRTLAPDLPVVGQTAHALAEEREKCLATGMADHIAKPIDIEELVAVVLRHVGAATTTRSATAPGADRIDIPPEPASAPLDWKALQAHFRSNDAFIERLAASLLRSHSQTPAVLRQAMGGQDWETLAFVGHKLKGVIGNLMLPELYRLVGEFEVAARERDPHAVGLSAALLPALEDMLARTRDFLAAQPH
jgi:CheY-like chemotaxis protein/HPt (histidine-containing phosphotransfer) domain-containing protein